MKDLFHTPLLLDGATGTELQKRGLPVGVCTEAWILDHPQALLDLQRAYVKVGARMLTAPTFGSSPAALARFGLAGRTAEYNDKLVALSRKAAAGETVLVAGDLAPSGRKNASAEELTENYAVQVKALKSAGVDLYLAETMISLTEAKAAVRAIRETDPGKLVLVSFYPGPVELTESFAAIQDMGVSGIGLNCAAPDIILKQLKSLAPLAQTPLLAMPGFEGRAPADGLARWAEEFKAVGVKFFGGCCGTDPAMLAELGKALKQD